LWELEIPDLELHPEAVSDELIAHILQGLNSNLRRYCRIIFEKGQDAVKQADNLLAMSWNQQIQEDPMCVHHVEAVFWFSA
jgi:hypothetical protein